MIIQGREEKLHKITAHKTSSKRLISQISSYYDPEKVIGWSRKKKKFVMKYPRRTFWKKYWMRRNAKKKLNKTKVKSKHG